MHVIQATTYDKRGGAAVAAYRLHCGLRRLGVDSTMVVAEKQRGDAHIRNVYASCPPWYHRLRGRIDGLAAKLGRVDPAGFVSCNWLPSRVVSRINRLQPDLVNLHWIGAGFIDLASLGRLRRPVVWTSHDMWAFCGAEHYSEADYWRDGNHGPAAASGLRHWFDVNAWVWRRKRRLWRDLPSLTFVCPSRWLAGCFRDSEIFGRHRVEVIANGIDEQRFAPVDKALARALLGVDPGKRYVLFGAVAALRDKRKGFHLLVDAVNCLADRSFEVLVFGADCGDDSLFPRVKVHYLGRIEHEALLPVVYSAADVFVAPSLQDNLPNTVMESLACGTPVVAFDIGGQGDMIDHQRNGVLVDEIDSGALAAGIDWVLADDQRRVRLGEQARRKVLDNFTVLQQARRYQALYRELIDRQRAG